jgi:hypothetical protein
LVLALSGQHTEILFELFTGIVSCLREVSVSAEAVHVNRDQAPGGSFVGWGMSFIVEFVFGVFGSKAICFC